MGYKTIKELSNTYNEIQEHAPHMDLTKCSCCGSIDLGFDEDNHEIERSTGVVMYQSDILECLECGEYLAEYEYNMGQVTVI